MITGRQRLARIAGAYTIGFGAGFAISIDIIISDPVITFIKAGIGGMLTALPQIKKMLEEYSHGR